MFFRNRAWHILLASSVFVIFCQEFSATLAPKTLVCNTGIGMGINIPTLFLIPLIGLSLFFAGFVVRKRLQESKTDSFLASLGGSLLFGGAISNILDRLFRGCVPDFFHISFFPTFNVADIGISVGVFILLFLVLKKS